MSTLVFHQGALGDSVLIWPLLRGLAADDDVTLIAAWSKAALAGRWVDGVEPLDGEAPDCTRLFAAMASLEISDELHARLAEARRILSFVSDGADAWAANVRAMAGEGRLVCVRPRPPAGWRSHVTDWHLAQLADRGVTVEPRMPPPREPRTGPIVVHPGSGGAAKCWPADRFAALIDRLQAAGRAVEVLLGEAELDRWPDERIRAWGRRFAVRTPGRLADLAEHLAGASVFVGNDSGPTHLAAQLATPTVALFGPTDPRVWAPLGPAVRVLAPPHPQSMDWLEIDAAIDAVGDMPGRQ
jgi:hypothetical protein